MNGQLFLMLLSMLLQNPSSEVLPGPNRNGAGFGNSAILPGNAVSGPPASMPPVRGRRQTGYAVDPLDGKFCLIIQIPPDEIGEFARGPAGQELTASVPEEIRNFRIEKVLFRIGTAPVEKNLPNSSALSESRTSTNPPQIVDLNNRTTVPIDQVRPSGNLATVAQNGLGFGGNATMNSNGNPPTFNNEVGTFPPVVPNAMNDRSRPISSSGDTGIGGTGRDLNYGQNTTFGQNATQARDGFTGPKSTFGNLLVPSQTNSGNSPYASSNNPYSPGNNTNPMTLGTNANRQYNIAANPNSPSSYYDSQLGQQNGQPLVPQGGFAPPPSQLQAQQYGQLPLQQPPYAGANQYGTSPMGEYAQRQVSVPKISSPILTSSELLEDPQIARDKLLPFLLLFSIVVNVYLGFWMSHLRTRYRQLLSNMRGIPVSDLA